MNSAKLDFYVKHNLNALFIGKAGIGKTAEVINCFNRNNLKYAYFSCATLDPWIDFVGIPKEKTENGKSYIELIKPKCFAEDTIEAIFFDEFNRSPKKVRNACMELIQFKSINGHKLNNLKIIWAAINPKDEEDTYDVEKLDPAQEDRFHVKIEVPYKPDRAYFKSKFGDIGLNAVDWWNELPDKQKDLVSPRRLDYAVDIFLKSGDLRDVLSEGVGIQKLIAELNNGSFIKQLDALVAEGDPIKISNALANENFYNSTASTIVGRTEYVKTLAPFLPKEKLANSLTDKEFVKKFTKAIGDPTPFMDVLSTLPTKNKTSEALKELETWKIKIKFYEKQAAMASNNTVKLNVNSSWIQQVHGSIQITTQTPQKIQILGILNDSTKVAALTNKEYELWIDGFETIMKSLQCNTLQKSCGLVVNALCKLMRDDYKRRFNVEAPTSMPKTMPDIINLKNTFATGFKFWTEPANYKSMNQTAQQLLNQLTGGKGLSVPNQIPS